MFIENKYTRHYYLLVNRAKNRQVDNISYQKHHIVPKSLGGNNSKDNLVKLTLREHYVAHLLLTKMTVGEARKKMCLAFFCMNTLNKGDSKHLNSRLFANHMKDISEMFTGDNNPAKHPDARRKISQRNTSYMKTPEYRKALSDGHKGKQTGGKNPAAKSVISPKGEIFETMKSAAEHYNMPWTTLQTWVRKNQKGWSYYSATNSFNTKM